MQEERRCGRCPKLHLHLICAAKVRRFSEPRKDLPGAGGILKLHLPDYQLLAGVFSKLPPPPCSVHVEEASDSTDWTDTILHRTLRTVSDSSFVRVSSFSPLLFTLFPNFVRLPVAFHSILPRTLRTVSVFPNFVRLPVAFHSILHRTLRTVSDSSFVRVSPFSPLPFTFLFLFGGSKFFTFHYSLFP